MTASVVRADRRAEEVLKDVWAAFRLLSHAHANCISVCTRFLGSGYFCFSPRATSISLLHAAAKHVAMQMTVLSWRCTAACTLACVLVGDGHIQGLADRHGVSADQFPLLWFAGHLVDRLWWPAGS